MTRRRLGLELARDMVDACLLVARRAGLAMTLAVCDGGGHMILVARMDQAPLVSLDAAPAKARTAVYFRRATGLTLARSRAHPTVYTSFVTSSPTPLVLSAGGFPLWEQDELVGAIAAAGGNVRDDARVVAGGLRVWAARSGDRGPGPADGS